MCYLVHFGQNNLNRCSAEERHEPCMAQPVHVCTSPLRIRSESISPPSPLLTTISSAPSGSRIFFASSRKSLRKVANDVVLSSRTCGLINERQFSGSRAHPRSGDRGGLPMVGFPGGPGRVVHQTQRRRRAAPSHAAMASRAPTGRPDRAPAVQLARPVPVTLLAVRSAESAAASRTRGVAGAGVDKKARRQSATGDLTRRKFA